MPRFLVDLSAWAHSGHPAVRGRWADLLAADRLLCHPVFAVELLHNAVNPADHRRLKADLDRGFDWVWPDRETAATAVEIQRRMATGAPTGQRVKTADLLVAALAVQHHVGVLHYDSDYDAIRAGGGERFQSEWVARRGSLENAAAVAASARKAYASAFGRRMVQLRDGTDLEVWPELLDWVDDRLRARGLEVPPPPDLP